MGLDQIAHFVCCIFTEQLQRKKTYFSFPSTDENIDGINFMDLKLCFFMVLPRQEQVQRNEAEILIYLEAI